MGNQLKKYKNTNKLQMFKTTFSVAVLASHASASISAIIARHEAQLAKIQDAPVEAQIQEAIDEGLIDATDAAQIHEAVDAGLIDDAEVADIVQDAAVENQIEEAIEEGLIDDEQAAQIQKAVDAGLIDDAAAVGIALDEAVAGQIQGLLSDHNFHDLLKDYNYGPDELHELIAELADNSDMLEELQDTLSHKIDIATGRVS